MRYARNPETIRNPLPYLWTVVKRVWATQNAHSSRAKTDSLDALDTETLESLSSIQVEPEVQAVLEREALRDELRLKLGPLTLEEQSLLELYLEDYSWAEIASTFGEDEKLTRFRWYKFIARQRYRLAKGKAKTQASGSF
jgi:DNA-directed RNA polymerase specialized sigma24 family protein